VNVINPANVVNGQILNEPLAKGRFLFSTSGYSIGRSQVMHITTPDYNFSDRTNVQVAFKSLWEQNQDSIAAVEYSIDGGTQWLPLAYLIDEADLVKAEDGSLDAEATLNKEHGDVANYTDDAGTVIGGTYGAFIGAPITASLAPFIQGRVNDNRVESKRYELFRVSGADNQSKVRFRFIHAGTDSWYWGIDDFGLYGTDTSVTPTAPILTLKASGDQYLIAWPSTPTGYVLESSPTLTPPSWTTVSGVSGTTVTVPADAAGRFFRLRKP
jgi:hypothetical protein